jgi:hypothetical protein
MLPAPTLSGSSHLIFNYLQSEAGALLKKNTGLNTSDINKPMSKPINVHNHIFRPIWFKLAGSLYKGQNGMPLKKFFLNLKITDFVNGLKRPYGSVWNRPPLVF